MKNLLPFLLLAVMMGLAPAAVAQETHESTTVVFLEEDFTNWTDDSIAANGWSTLTTSSWNFISPYDDFMRFFKQDPSNWMLLILPGLDLSNATMLIFDYKAESSVAGMKFKIGVMTDPTDTNTFTMLGQTNVTNFEWMTDTVFLSGLTGTQYLAFNAMGPPPFTLLNLDNVIVTGDAAQANWPSFVTDLDAVPGPDGSEWATVSWTNPNTEADGDPLTDLDSVVVLANDVWAYTLENPVIGQPVNAQVTVPAAGFYVFTVTAFNTAGASTPMYSDTVWVGLDTPGPVQDLVMTVVNDSTSSLEWTAPISGAHGAFYNNVVASYRVIRADGTEFTVNGNTYTFGEMFETPGTYNYTVIPINNSGFGTPAASNAGAFYFDGYLLWEDYWVEAPAFGWSEAGDGTEKEWFMSVGGFAGGNPPEAFFWPRYWIPFNGIHRMISPALNTEGFTALSLDFQYYPEVDLGPFTFKVETTSDGGTTWNTVWTSNVTQTLDPANINILFKNDDIGSTDFQFAYTFEGYNLNAYAIYVDAIRLYPSVGVDLAPMALTMPDYIRPDDQVTPTAVIKSYGSLDTVYTAVLTFFNGTDTLYKSTLTGPIAAGQTDSISFGLWTAVEGSYEAILKVTCPGDERPDNNILTREFGVYNPVGSRTMVICEDFTGTWCAYCPGAAMGLDELVENSWPVAVIAYHISDPYETTEGSVRDDYYQVSGYPTVHFDGIGSVVGGYATQSMYSEYVPLVEARISVDADASVTIQDLNVVDSTLTGNIVLASASPMQNPNLALHAVVTESHIPVQWQNQEEVNFTERTMMNGADGTPVDLSDMTETIPISLTLSSLWDRPNTELVVFVQDMVTKEILNGNKITLDHVGIREAMAGISIYPNPSDGNFRVRSDSRIEGITVIDFTGRVLPVQTVRLNDNLVGVSGLPAGLFITRIRTSSGEVTGKVMVE